MPSKSKHQHNFMEMVEHEPGAAKRTVVPKKVAKEYVKADKAAGKQALRKLPAKVKPK